MPLPVARRPLCSAAHDARGPAAQGARIGVMRQMIDNSSADPEVMRLFQAALDAMAGAGARVTEDVRIRGNSLGDRDWDGKTNAWCVPAASHPRLNQLLPRS
jgi:Asp-tRNA(Asn)/Glu-tRNA(Gln) amidotransferase A subunit family amidase